MLRGGFAILEGFIAGLPIFSGKGIPTVRRSARERSRSKDKRRAHRRAVKRQKAAARKSK